MMNFMNLIIDGEGEGVIIRHHKSLWEVDLNFAEVEGEKRDGRREGKERGGEGRGGERREGGLRC